MSYWRTLFKSKEMVYETFTSWIKGAFDNVDTLETVSGNIDFDLHLTTAAPLALAAVTMGKHKGQHAEAILALIECNSGIVEAPGTRVTHNVSSSHFIGVNQATLIGSDSSSKTSNLIATSNEWLVTANAPRNFATFGFY